MRGQGIGTRDSHAEAARVRQIQRSVYNLGISHQVLLSLSYGPVKIIPIVSIVVPFLVNQNLYYKILTIKLVNPKKGTTMETIGTLPN